MFWWIAEYKDGTVIRQQKEDGTIVSADSIDRDKIKTFSLMNGEACVVKLHLLKGEKLIYRRRVEKTVGGPERACHIIGHRKYVGHEGDIAQATMFVFEDGGIEMISDFQEDHPWFYEPKLREFELPWQ